MAKRVQSWRPDTCGCFLLLEFDTVDTALPPVALAEYTNPKGERFVAIKCPRHSTADNPAAHYAGAQSENTTKNLALKAAEDALPVAYRKQALDSDGEPIIEDGKAKLVPKDKHAPQWSIDATGAVKIKIPGLLKADELALDTAIKTVSGAVLEIK